MPLLNSLDVVWQKFIALVVIFFVFYWLYRNMKENKFKGSIRDFFENFKKGENDLTTENLFGLFLVAFL